MSVRPGERLRAMKKTCECGGTVTADPRVFDRAWAHHQETCPAKPPAKVKEKVG